MRSKMETTINKQDALILKLPINFLCLSSIQRTQRVHQVFFNFSNDFLMKSLTVFYYQTRQLEDGTKLALMNIV